MERVSRVKSVEYAISFIARRNETYVYIGSMWAGRILHEAVGNLHNVEKFSIYLQLPGMWGPVARGDTLSLAKFAATEAIKRWLSRFAETPEPPPEHFVREVAKRDKWLGLIKKEEEPAKRVRRTRAVEEPSTVRRITRRRG